MAQLEFDESMAEQLEVLYHRRDIVRPAVDVDGSNTYATADVSRVDLAVRLARWPFVSEDTSAFITALLDGRVIPSPARGDDGQGRLGRGRS